MGAPAKPLFDVDLTRDLRAVEAMTEPETLKHYLYGTELYGELGNNTMPKLTMGSLLMRLHRLNALRERLAPAQALALEKAVQVFEGQRKEWAFHYEGKLLHEVKSRLTALGQFLAEAEENPRLARENYPSAMEKRVMIEWLKDDLERLGKWDEELTGTLANVDNRIRRAADQVDWFIWDERVVGAYPPEPFWFLYRLPPQKR
ncbi:MAG TPA: hypothetical protein PLD47_14810 [Aggregatilineales bacterium]|nr:hypothetical protein [Anaerolineales bacterium]HRE48996.1 hypothetical protein [Aggregatilineales bacterium]